MIKITIKNFFLLYLFSFSIFNLQSFFITEVKNYRQETLKNLEEYPKKTIEEPDHNFWKLKIFTENIFKKDSQFIWYGDGITIGGTNKKKLYYREHYFASESWANDKNGLIYRDQGKIYNKNGLIYRDQGKIYNKNWFDFKNSFNNFIYRSIPYQEISFLINYQFHRIVPVDWKLKEDFIEYKLPEGFREISYNNGSKILFKDNDSFFIIDKSDEVESKQVYYKDNLPRSREKDGNLDESYGTRLNNWFDFENDLKEKKEIFLDSLTFWIVKYGWWRFAYFAIVPIFWKIKSDNPPTKNPQQHEEKKINKSQWEKFKKDHYHLISDNNSYQEIEKFFIENSKGTLNFKWTETYNSDGSVKEIIIDEVSDKKPNKPIDKPTPTNPGEKEPVKEININKNKWEDFKKAHPKLDTTNNLYKEIEDFFEKHKNGSLDFEWRAEYENNIATKVTILNASKKNNNDNNQNLPREDDSSSEGINWIWWLNILILIILIIIVLILIKKKLLKRKNKSQ